MLQNKQVLQGICDRAAKKYKYRQMIHKCADKISGKPYNLKLAADELKAWVDEKDPGTPLLDVSYCQMVVRDGSLSAAIVPLSSENCYAQAVAVEVEPGQVTLGKTPAPQLARASADGKMIYNMAGQLVSHHNYEWSLAIRTAEDLFKNSKKVKGKGKGKVMRTAIIEEDDDDDDNDDNRHVLDIVPFR